MHLAMRFLIIAWLSLASVGLAQTNLCPPGATCATIRKDGVTGPDTYSTITAAMGEVQSKGYNRLLVYPGVYRENIVIGVPNLTLEAVDGPLLTQIDGSGAANTSSCIAVNSGITGIRIIGFNLAAGRRGINVNNAAGVEVYNCVFDANREAGLRVEWSSGTVPTAVSVINNVFLDTTAGPGFQGVMYGFNCGLCCGNEGYDTPFMTVLSNIFDGNASSAIHVLSLCGNTVQKLPLNGSRFTFDYNVFLTNGPDGVTQFQGPVGRVAGGSGIFFVGGPGNLYTGPSAFVDSANTIGRDVRLGTNSAARDKGVLGSRYDDPDGTRNDMGAFGGPYCQRFFTSASDGPIVHQIIAPASVRKGETLTIEAVGKTR